MTNPREDKLTREQIELYKERGELTFWSDMTGAEPAKPGNLTKLCNMALAYLASLSAEKRVEAQEWRPIETAPRDGTRLLVINNRLPKFQPSVAWYETESINDFWSTYGRFQVCPTHWMPLPHPPKGGEI